MTVHLPYFAYGSNLHPARLRERVGDVPLLVEHMLEQIGKARGRPTPVMRTPVLDVLLAVLGGQAGRLFVALRGAEGLVYHVSASSSEGVDAGKGRALGGDAHLQAG